MNNIKYTYFFVNILTVMRLCLKISLGHHPYT